MALPYVYTISENSLCWMREIYQLLYKMTKLVQSVKQSDETVIKLS